MNVPITPGYSWLNGEEPTATKLNLAAAPTAAFTAIDGVPIGAVTPSTGAFTTLSASGAITPSQTAGIVGTTTNNNANAGSFGEYLTAERAVGSPLSLTTGVYGDITSLSLTAGDWDVQGLVKLLPSGGPAVDYFDTGISTASVSLNQENGYIQRWLGGLVLGAEDRHLTPMTRLSLSGTTTAYLPILASFTGTLSVYGFIRARRVR